MSTRSFTIQLDGTVSLGRFAAALDAWQLTLSAIAENVGSSHILAMNVEDLASGSAVIQVDVEFDTDDVATTFQRDYIKVGTQLRDGNIIDFPKRFREPLEKLRDAARRDGDNGMTLSSDDADILILSTGQPESFPGIQSSAANVEALGIVIGKLQAISSRKSLKVMVYDIVNDRAVRCSLSQEQHELARELWDTEVIVEGLVRRDPVTGQALSMRNVESIAPRPTPRDRLSWQRARGALKHIRPDLSSEELIRLARNG